MLKQLRIRNNIFKIRNTLKKAEEAAADFKKRQGELAAQLADENLSEEDLKEVETAISNLEQEIDTFGETVKNDLTDALGENAPAEIGEEVDDKISTLKNALNELEQELSKSEEKEPEMQPETQPATGECERTKGEPVKMKRRGIFNSLSIEERNRIMNDEQVRSFMPKLRSIMQTRAVTGTDLTIPDIMVDTVRDNLHKYSKLINVVNLKPVPGKARQTVIGAIPEAIWTETIASINELSFGFGRIEVDGFKVAGFIPIPNAYLEDSDLALAAEIIEVLAQSIGLGLDKAIVYGKGIKMPLGIVTRLAQISKPSDWPDIAPAWTNLSASNILKIDGASFKDTQFFAALLRNLGVIKANYAATQDKFWVMSERTHTEIMAKAVNFNAAGAIVNGMDSTMPVIGGQIIELPFIPDGDIIGGYGSLYFLAQRAGIDIKTSEHAMFIEDMTVYRGVARYDGRPTFGEGFVALNINNTDVTTTMTFAAAAASASGDDT